MKIYHSFIFILLFLGFMRTTSSISLPHNFIPLDINITDALSTFAAGAWSGFKTLLDSVPGESRAAIVPLKQYLSTFGYLNLTGVQNITDLFDDDTLNAIKLYQESFNLTVTGRLDLQTLLKIITPRCGREDVADGIPLMLQSTESRFSSHVVGHYSYFPSKPTWPSSKRNLTYAFSSLNETERLSSDERRQAFANAFSEWSAVIPINFTEISDYASADIKIEFVSYSHGDGEPFDGVLGILAHAFSPTDGRFHLDDSEFWYSSSSGSSNTIPQGIDLQSVVTHEIGHLIGLAHSRVENSIMYPSITPGQVKVQLQQDDIQGAQGLYGANPDYDPNKPLPGVSSSLEDFNRASALLLSSTFYLNLTLMLFLVIFYNL